MVLWMARMTVKSTVTREIPIVLEPFNRRTLGSDRDILLLLLPSSYILFQ